MSSVKLRTEIKKAIDRLPIEQLTSVADYVGYLTRPTLKQRVLSAEKAVAAGKGVNWRKVRLDV